MTGNGRDKAVAVLSAGKSLPRRGYLSMVCVYLTKVHIEIVKGYRKGATSEFIAQSASLA